jgi:hypothetical protein
MAHGLHKTFKFRMTGDHQGGTKAGEVEIEWFISVAVKLSLNL